MGMQMPMQAVPGVPPPALPPERPTNDYSPPSTVTPAAAATAARRWADDMHMHDHFIAVL